MKIVFMGTPEFAVPCLQKIIDEGHEVLAVVTQPDKPKGRGKKIVYSPVKETALKYNIPIFQPHKIREVDNINEIKKYNPDVIIVVAFGQILPKDLIELPKYGCINVHGSLLPKYRGAAPIQWSIINGETITGITTMFMDVGIDTGDILLQKEIDIDNLDTYGSLYNKMSLEGAELLIQTLIKLEDNTLIPQKQDNSKSTYSPLIDKKEICHINWNKTSKCIINLIRGLNPSPTAYTYYDNETLKIFKAVEINKEYDSVPGKIVDIVKNQGFIVKTLDSAIIITELQGQNGKRMSTSDYMRGHNIELNKTLS